MIGPRHEPGRSLQRSAAGVFISASGRDHRLLADHAFPAYLADPPPRIGDPPIAREQLDRESAPVFDGHMVGPEETVLLRVGLIVEKIWFDRDANVARDLFVKASGQARGSTMTSVFTELAMKQ